MNRDRIQNRVTEIILAAIERDERAGFGFARSIPSRVVGQFLLAYQRLSAREKFTVKRSLAKNRSVLLGQPVDPQAREIVGAFSKDMLMIPPESPPPRPIPEIAELKKLAALSMAQLLDAKSRPTGEPGQQEYAGVLGGERIAVRMRYGTRMRQLEYEVRLERLSARKKSGQIVGLNYEALVGIGTGSWDRITITNIDRNFATLKEAIARTVRICSDAFGVIDAEPGNAKPSC